MNNTNLTLGEAGSLLLGAGLVKLDDIVIGLALIAVGALLKITVAILNKNGVVVESNLG